MLARALQSLAGVIAHVLQPWTSLWIKAQTPPNSVRQSEDGWLALDGFRDLAVWVHVSQIDAGGNVSFNIEGSPTCDETFFVNRPALVSLNITTPGVYFGLSRGLTSIPTTATPLERYVRWAALPGAAADCAMTFRIVVCVNPVVPDFRMTCGDRVFTNPALGGS